MARIIVLDSGPLGIAARSPAKPDSARCQAWLNALEWSGALVALPEIADYEVRRELLRAGVVNGVRRLDALKARFLFVPITSAAMLKAAWYWADARRGGVPTAAPDALDGDCIVAGQAATVGGPGDVVTIATTNPAHLNRFPGVDARLWSAIT